MSVGAADVRNIKPVLAAPLMMVPVPMADSAWTGVALASDSARSSGAARGGNSAAGEHPMLGVILMHAAWAMREPGHRPPGRPIERSHVQRLPIVKPWT